MIFLVFLAGLVTGGLIGVMVMALMVAARSSEDTTREEHINQ